MFRFENPSAFNYLFVLPILLIFIVIAWRMREKNLEKALNARLKPFLVSSRSVRKRQFKIVLEVLVVIFAVFALARPQYGQSSQKVRSQGIEVIVALDVSNSMMAEDMKPNRLEHARNEIGRLLSLLSGDKVGLVAFAGSALLLSPMTNDYSAIRMFVDSATPNSVSTQGTDFKSAIEVGLNAMKRGGLDSDEQLHVTKIMVLVTDGESTTSDALDMARKAAKEGLRIFTLGLGTRAGAPIPERDEFGNLQGYKKDKSNKTILSTAKEEALLELAQAGGGAYYHADFSGQAVESLKKDIDKMQKSEFDSDFATNYDEKYQSLLAVAIFLALIEFLLGERKRDARFWRGRFEVAQ